MSADELKYLQNNHEHFQFQLSSGDAYDARCGEIFITLHREIVLHCSLCDNKYASFAHFIDHLSTKHYNADLEEFAEVEIDESEIDTKPKWELDSSIEENTSPDQDSNSLDQYYKEEAPDLEEVDEDYLEEIEQVVIQSTSEFNEKDDYFEIEEEEVDDAFCGIECKDKPKRKNAEQFDDVTINGEEETRSAFKGSTDQHELYADNYVDVTKIQKSASSKKEQSHICAKRKRGANQSYECEFCKKTFFYRHRLLKHLIIHSEERKHKCQICDFAFKDYSNLVAHIKRHTDPKKFGCEVCPKKFFTKTESRLHRRVHTGERPYVCSYCGLTFITSGGLSGHVKRHQTEPSFPCTQCEKGFYKKADLKDHMLVHTRERNFICSVCAHTFPRRKSMLRHMKLHTRSKSSS